MKPKVIVFFLVFCLGLVFLVEKGFCAEAPKKLTLRHISEGGGIDAAAPDLQRVPPRVPTKYLTSGAELTCEDIWPGIGDIIRLDQVGETCYDRQKSGAMDRVLSVTDLGYRHFSWTYTDGSYPGFSRYLNYNCLDPLGYYLGPVHADGGTENDAHRPSLDYLLDDIPAIAHRRKIGSLDWFWVLTVDDDKCGGFFSRTYDLPDVIDNALSGKPAKLLEIGAQRFILENKTFMHLSLGEGDIPGGGTGWMGYVRCALQPPYDLLGCATCRLGATQNFSFEANVRYEGNLFPVENTDRSRLSIIITGCLRFKDQTYGRVAVVYLRPAYYESDDYLYDVCYMESMNNGDDWINGSQWPPIVHNITNYGCSGTERAYNDLSACYDYDDSLHIVWVTCGFDPANPGYYDPHQARMYHWSKKTGTSMITRAIWEDTNPGANNCNIAKVNISAKDPIYHPGGDSVYLYTIWTQFDPGDNAENGYTNGDIYGCGSFDGGNTWGGVFNLTNTKAPGCAPGNCLSEHWPSLAENMYDGDLHIQYICDRDGGAAVDGEGEWTSNPVMYLHLTEWEITTEPRADFKIKNPIHWYHPPLKVSPGGSRSLTFGVYSIGNANLIWSAGSADPCIQGSASGTLVPRDSAVVTFTLDGGGGCSGTFIDGTIDLTTNEGVAGTTYTLPLQAVVARDYYECPKDPETVDTLYNGVLVLAVNANCGEAISDSGTIADTALDVFFEGGSIIATTIGSDTLVGRFMREDRHAGVRDKLYKEQCEPDWEPDFWIVYTKDIFMHNLEPPADHRWYWWESSKQIKFFKDTAPEDYKRLVIKYVKVRRHDPPDWWPDQTPFSSYDDTYIGVAEDIDCPWDSSQGEPNINPKENATNEGGYDAVSHIAWQRGFGSGEHPHYNNYYCGIALANGGGGDGTVPYGTYCVKNNHYLFPQGGWGWRDAELYWLASQTGNNIEHTDSLVDRSYVFTAAKIDAGTDPNREASFTVILAAAPNGLAQLQALIDTGRAIVAREYTKGYPVLCGDVNYDHAVGAGDIVYLLSYLFRGGPQPPCPIIGRADVNLDGSISAGDVVFLLSYLFRGGPPPDCPGIWGP